MDSYCQNGNVEIIAVPDIIRAQKFFSWNTHSLKYSFFVTKVFTFIRGSLLGFIEIFHFKIEIKPYLSPIMATELTQYKQFTYFTNYAL